MTRFLSVCSGIEAASAAWHPLGWRAAAFSEVEAFPSAVLAHHYPSVPNWGDMTKFQEWPDANVDVLVGGTPCQSFSVAGLRKGLADPRGNLMLTYLAIANRYRPRWLVWENVPGVLSSNGGKDFGTFLGGLAELGYGFAYRVLDAQFFGVPQRRRRVFVVGCAGDWRRAAAVLFERESLSGNPAPRREAREGVAPTISARTKGGGGLGTDFDLDGGLIEQKPGRSLGCRAQNQGTARGGNNCSGPIDLATACQAHGGPHGRLNFESETFITQAVNGGGFDVAPVAFNCDARPDEMKADELSVVTRSQRSAVAFSENQRGDVYEAGAVQSLNKGGGKPGQGYAAARIGSAVRRLTPRECERLQGFPDDYTLIPVRGKPAADGPRYKALGNSMAVPVMHWIGSRLQAVDELALERAA